MKLSKAKSVMHILRKVNLAETSDFKSLDYTVQMLNFALNRQMYDEFRSLCIDLSNRIARIVNPDGAAVDKSNLFSDPEMQKVYTTIYHDSQLYTAETLTSDFCQEFVANIQKFITILAGYIKRRQVSSEAKSKQPTLSLSKFSAYLAISVLFLIVLTVLFFTVVDMSNNFIKPLATEFLADFRMKYIDINLMANRTNKDVVSLLDGVSPVEFDEKTGQAYFWALGPKVVLRFFSSTDGNTKFAYSFSNIIDSMDIKVYINGRKVKEYNELTKFTWLRGETREDIQFTPKIGINTIEIDLSKWNGRGADISSVDDRPLGVPFTQFRVYSDAH